MEYISQEFNEIKKLIRACHNRETVKVKFNGELMLVVGYWPVIDVPPEPLTYGFKLKSARNETIRTN